MHDNQPPLLWIGEEMKYILILLFILSCSKDRSDLIFTEECHELGRLRIGETKVYVDYTNRLNCKYTSYISYDPPRSIVFDNVESLRGAIHWIKFIDLKDVK